MKDNEDANLLNDTFVGLPAYIYIIIINIAGVIYCCIIMVILVCILRKHRKANRNNLDVMDVQMVNAKSNEHKVAGTLRVNSMSYDGDMDNVTSLPSIAVNYILPPNGINVANSAPNFAPINQEQTENNMEENDDEGTDDTHETNIDESEDADAMYNQTMTPDAEETDGKV